MIWQYEAHQPEIASDAWVAPDANVIGKVRLGAGASIWFGATLRGDNEWICVGEDTNIQEGAICHTDIGFPLDIGAQCTIGHQAILHGCRIGDRALIGMGATIMNGAEIGADCIIGAGALVAEGKRIPAGSLVIGGPGRIIRELSDDEKTALIESAENYRKKAERFRQTLRAVSS